MIKLRSGAQYDLIWPSTEYVYRLAREGLLARFDRDALRNRDNVAGFYDHPGGTPTPSTPSPTPTTRPGSPGARTRSAA